MTVRMLLMLVFAGAGAVASDAVAAACSLKTWTIEGLVVDADGAPIAGATIEARWEERANGTMSNRRDTDAAGRFTAPVAFDPYSGKTFGGTDKCEATLDEVTLVVSKSGFRSRALTLAPEKIDEPVRVELQPGR